MNVPSIFKPLVRALSSLSSRDGSLSRTSSVGSTASRADSLASLDSVDSLKSHLSWHGEAAAKTALVNARAAGLLRPKAAAKKAGRAAIAKETARVQKLFASRHAAEMVLIRARGQQRLAGLKLRQAERQHGPHSLIAHEARKASLAATRALGAASADLYVATLSL